MKEINVLDKRLKSRYHRRYNRWKELVRDIQSIRVELGIRALNDADHLKLTQEIERIYKEAKQKLNQLRSGFTRPRGRPIKLPQPEQQYCAKKGCMNKPAKGFIYCSRECAPCGHYGYNTRPRG